MFTVHPAAEALPGLGHLHHVVFLMAHVVFLFGAETGIQIGKEAVRLLLVHLLEVGHPLLGHLAAPPVVANYYVLVQPWCQPKKLGASSEGLFTEMPGS